MNESPSSQRAVWLAIIFTASLSVSLGAGLLFFVAGAEPTTILGVTGTVFAGSTGLGLAAHSFIAG